MGVGTEGVAARERGRDCFMASDAADSGNSVVVVPGE